MDIIAEFDPNAASSGTFSINTLSNGIGKLICWNESNWTLRFTFPNRDQDLVPAWTATIFELTGPQGKITWTQDTQLAANIPPISKVWVVAYRDDETIAGTFPLALVRQTNVGNAGTVMAATTSIQNDGNIAGTSLVEATVGADIPSAVTLDNVGNLQLGNATRKGTLKMPDGIDIFTSSDGDVLTTSGSDTFLKARAGKVVLESSNGVHDLEVSSTGIKLVGALTFAVGSLSRIAVAGPLTVDPVAAFVNHNLGATPDYVFAISGALTAVLISITADFATMTGTQVKLQSNTHLSAVYILSIKL
jgi:hypothetical protein